MEHPLSPTVGMRKWKWATVATASISAAITLIYVTILTDQFDVSNWLLPRILQLAVYLSAIGAASCAARLNHEGTRMLINQRVAEAAARMDQRMIYIGRCIGAKLEENTGEIKRVQADVELDGYAKGFADGRAVATNGRAIGRVTVVEPTAAPAAEVLPSPATVAAIQRLMRKISD